MSFPHHDMDQIYPSSPLFQPHGEFPRECQVFLHHFTVLPLAHAVNPRSYPRNHEISCNLRADQRQLFIQLGLTDYLTITQFFDKALYEMLAIT